MSEALLVVNASPQIFLGNAGHLELLHTLGASRIIVPEPVFDEVISGGYTDRLPFPNRSLRGRSGRVSRR